MKPSLSSSLIAAICATGLAACGGGGGGDGNGNGGSQQQSGFSLAITDAPVDAATQVVVSFNSVTLKPVAGEAIEFSFEPAKAIDLLALQGNASTMLLDSVDVPSGDYEWIRLGVLADDCNATEPASFIELDDGGIEPLFVPSGAQSGLKLNSAFSLATGGLGDFVIDFDLRKSVVKPNGRSCHHLKPSMRLIDNLVAGGIVGSVESDLLFAEGCGDASAVYVYAGANAVADDEGSANPPLTSAAVGLNEGTGLYEYNAAFMAPGDYTVAFTCQAASDTADSDEAIDFYGSATVTVQPGQDAQHDFVAPTTGDVFGTVSSEMAEAEGCSPAVYVYSGMSVVPDDIGSATAPAQVANVSFNDGSQAYEYRASELLAGDYSLAFTCDADIDTVADEDLNFSEAADINIPAGGKTEHNFTAPVVEPPIEA